MINNNQIQPNNLKFSLFFSKNILWLYLYNKNYSILLKIKNSSFKILSSQTIILNNRQESQQQTYPNNVKKYLKQIDVYIYVKIKFSGKGYKIKKNSNKSIVLLFNRAHITHLWWKNIILKKLKKYKIYIRFTQTNSGVLKTIKNIRNINIFTKKGLRQSKQILFKKKGKK